MSSAESAWLSLRESAISEHRNESCLIGIYPDYIDIRRCVSRTCSFDLSSTGFENEAKSLNSSGFQNFILLGGSSQPMRDLEETKSSSSASCDSHRSITVLPSIKKSAGLQLIRDAYSGSESSSPVSSPSGPKKLKRECSSDSSERSASRSSSVSSVGSVASTSTVIGPQLPPSVTEIRTKSNVPTTSRIRFSMSLPMKQRSFEIPMKKVPTEVNRKLQMITSQESVALTASTSTKMVKSNGYGTRQVRIDADEPKPSTSKDFPDGLPVVNGHLHTKEGLLNGSMSVPAKSNGAAVQPKVMNGVVIKTQRKRLLSDRGEAAAKYPVIDRQNLFTTWQGSRLVRPGSRNAGVGLFNHSNDCFLNAVLQTVVHTAPLARFVAEQHSPVNCAQNCFICAMGAHVRRAITSPTPFKAQWIQPFLRKVFPSHTPGFQEDAHELFTLLLDALDPTPPAGSKQNASPSSSTNPVLEVRASTPVEQIFGGTLRNQIRCLGCLENFVNYERIRELNLGMRMRKADGIVRIDELLSDYFGTEVLNQYDCKKCGKKTQAQRSTRVLRAPNVLLVQLKRFNSFGYKIRQPVTFELNLRLDRFMFHAGESNVFYTLNGLIEHQGTGIDHGHYIAVVRGFDDKNWHLFDDEISQRVSPESVQKRQAYLMIYTRRETCSEEDTYSGAVTSSQQFVHRNHVSGSSPAAVIRPHQWQGATTSNVSRTAAT